MIYPRSDHTNAAAGASWRGDDQAAPPGRSGPGRRGRGRLRPPGPWPAGPGPPGPTSTVQAAPSTLPAAPAGWPQHTSADGGFRLRYPPGWQVTESTGSAGVALSLLPPRGDGISVLAT
ncbi:MAG TPA: hypothetical protein VLA80_10685, partial [Actinomycetota bacterium]|nr:hypothetical protein [Actinomycetota bacterium]